MKAEKDDLTCLHQLHPFQEILQIMQARREHVGLPVIIEYQSLLLASIVRKSLMLHQIPHTTRILEI
jgi:hypothetical protein